MANVFEMQPDGKEGDERREFLEMLLSEPWPTITEDDGSEPERIREASPCSLKPELVYETQSWLMFVPAVLNSLKGQWSQKSWTHSEVEIANLVSEYLALDSNGIEVHFESGADSGNRAALNAIVIWFRELSSNVSMYAAMCAPLSFGPYVGLDLDLKPLEIVVSTKQIDEHIELRLGTLPGGATCQVLQGFFDGELCWSWLISTLPNETILHVEFGVADPESYGAHGWLVETSITYDYRGYGIPAWLCLGPNGEPLFYSVNW